MKQLYLANNQISDLTGIDRLNNVELLWIGNNKINNVESISKMSNLIELEISDSEIKRYITIISIRKFTSAEFRRELYL